MEKQVTPDGARALPYEIEEAGSADGARPAFICDTGRNVVIMVDARRRFQDPLPIAKAIVAALNGTTDPATQRVLEAARALVDGFNSPGPWKPGRLMNELREALAARERA